MRRRYLQDFYRPPLHSLGQRHVSRGSESSQSSNSEFGSLCFDQWVKNLKGVAFDGEDVLDETNCEVLRHKVDWRTI
ncbi:hypothetical protein L3X38_012799 [Prunus dulcis]|uniref:Disease resistance N-terminal domain-containing protein n=1 Tax=Prunus dulcis TaxID=3755 RepID=A0AAD4WMB1_PRUDU|nr:hypothetical protein L3X38_012799 [Prunus dulcis]